MAKIGTSKRGKLNDKIHAEMRRIALKRHPYCVVCGRSDGILQGGHLIPKANSTAVRYDLMNVFTQCSGCNSLHRLGKVAFIKKKLVDSTWVTLPMSTHIALYPKEPVYSGYYIIEIWDLEDEAGNVLDPNPTRIKVKYEPIYLKVE